MLREYFKSWNKFEITLVLLGTMGVIVFGCIFKSAILAMICSIASIITAMLQAKGKVESQFVSILVCLLYSYISYTNRYYGEVIFYMIIMLPMSVGGIISWLTHKSDKTDSVEVNEIKLKEWIFIGIISVLAFIGLYYVLKFFNTSELVVSTFSMIASLLAVYLLVRRSKYCFIFYLINDIILIILWGLPIISGNLLFIPMVIDPFVLLISDRYGTFNWNKIEKEQIN